MLHIECMTIGEEFKSNDKNYKVTSNFSDGGKIFVELHEVVNGELQELLKEN